MFDGIAMSIDTIEEIDKKARAINKDLSYNLELINELKKFKLLEFKIKYNIEITPLELEKIEKIPEHVSGYRKEALLLDEEGIKNLYNETAIYLMQLDAITEEIISRYYAFITPNNAYKNLYIDSMEAINLNKDWIEKIITLRKHRNKFSHSFDYQKEFENYTMGTLIYIKKIVQNILFITKYILKKIRFLLSLKNSNYIKINELYKDRDKQKRFIKKNKYWFTKEKIEWSFKDSKDLSWLSYKERQELI